MNGQLTSNERIGQWIDERRRSGTGDPVCAYIYDLAGLRSHVSSMLDAMPGGARLYYAIKANPDRRMLETLLPLVAGFEVASAGELRLVREVSADVPVLFGGPGKKDAELREALRLGVKYVHVESLLELRKLLLFAEEAERGIDVLLRVNLRSDALPQTRITMGGRPTPFGLDESFVEEAIALLRDAGHRHVRFAGFHFHSLSNNLDAELHAAMVEYYVRRVAAWKAAYGLEIKAINAGGGFGVSYDSAAGFDWGLFCRLLSQSPILREMGDTELLFEPGRLIVADYGYYAAEIVDIKRSHGRWFAVLRGGTHHNRLPASWGHDHPFQVFPVAEWPYPFERPEAARGGRVTIVGELCTPKDRLHADAETDGLRAGDIVVFEKSGAYCWTISHHDFLGHPHPEFHYLT